MDYARRGLSAAQGLLLGLGFVSVIIYVFFGDDFKQIVAVHALIFYALSLLIFAFTISVLSQNVVFWSEKRRRGALVSALFLIVVAVFATVFQFVILENVSPQTLQVGTIGVLVLLSIVSFVASIINIFA